MNVQVTAASVTRKQLVVSLDVSEVDAAHREVAGEVAKMARLPGFRPGKAPLALVQKRFAKEIADEFKQKLTADAYRGALEKEKLDVLSLVKVDGDAFAPGKPATVTFVVDVRPEFTLPAYVDLPTEIAPTEPTAEEIAQVIEGLRADRADFKAADRESRKGDYVKLGYEGKVDGKPITELAPDKELYGKVPQTWEEVEGTNEGVIPGLGAQIAGLKAGQARDVKITFPADFAPVPALAGKQATYSVEVQEVRERVLPPLDAEFFKAHQVDDLAGMENQVKTNLRLRKEHENRVAQRRQVTDRLAAGVEFEAPESMINAETQGVLRQFIEENMRRGVPAEQFEKDKKALFESARKAALHRVRLQLVLVRIAEQEKINISDSDINEFIYRESVRTRQSADKVAKALASDRDQLRGVQQSILFDKAVDFVVSKAKVTTVAAKA